MSTEHTKSRGKTRLRRTIFYLARFLGCTGYDLIDLCAEGRRKVFAFRDRPRRRDDVLPFYRVSVAVPPLAFYVTIKHIKALLHNA